MGLGDVDFSGLTGGVEVCEFELLELLDGEAAVPEPELEELEPEAFVSFASDVAVSSGARTTPTFAMISSSRYANQAQTPASAIASNHGKRPPDL